MFIVQRDIGGVFEHTHVTPFKTVNINNNSSICTTHWQTVKLASKCSTTLAGGGTTISERESQIYI